MVVLGMVVVVVGGTLVVVVGGIVVGTVVATVGCAPAAEMGSVAPPSTTQKQIASALRHLTGSA